MRTRVNIVTICGLGVAAAALLLVAGAGGQPTTQPAAGADGEREALMAALRQVVVANLRASQAEDLPAAMATLHPASPVAGTTRLAMQTYFRAFDLKYELLSLSWIGRDADYAVLRFRQKTTKVAGEAFQDNILDGLHVFRRYGEAWKIWTTVPLEATPLGEPR